MNVLQVIIVVLCRIVLVHEHVHMIIYEEPQTFQHPQTLAYGWWQPEIPRPTRRTSGMYDKTLEIMGISTTVTSTGYMGVSLNGGTPQNTPKWSFLVGKPHGCWVPVFLI